MTHCNQISFDTRLSDRKDPFGSDKSSLKRQNSWSVSFAGSVSAAWAAALSRPSAAMRH
jgi:hypothetical protein